MNKTISSILIAAAMIAVGSTAHVGTTYAAEAGKVAAKKTSAQKAYAAPEELFQALADAAKTNDSKALVSLLGAQGDSLVNSGDAVRDKQSAENFAASYADKHSITKDGDARATLVVGKDDWPMPIPAVKGPRGWTLDTSAGAKEILARRIGQNELDTIQVAQAMVDAERDYASEDRNADGLREYTAKFISSPGKKDGLYWPTKEGEPPSPLGPLAAEAAGEGYKGKQGTPTPFHGYYYRLLTAQGKDAQGGARSYIANGRMIGGFALVAYPAIYGNSGIMTFIVNHDGVVYEKDLGPNTVALAKAMKTYNPDSTWKAVK
jgi:hypothetical protein